MTNRYGRFAVTTALGLALAMVTGNAYAQDPAASPPTEGTAPAGGDATTPPATTSGGPTSASLAPTDVTLRQGAISIDGDIVIGMSKDFAGKPIQIVPNLYYGVNDALTVGIAHNTNAEIFQANSVLGGRGLCLSGESDGCRKLYNNLSLDALFSFMRSSTMDLAAHGGIDFFFLNDPNWTQLRVGLKGKMMAGPVIIVFDPALFLGLNNRDSGNKEAINIPARFGFMVTPQLNLGLSIALGGPLDGFGDNYVVPLGIGGAFAINSQLDVRAQFAFNNLLGNVEDPVGRADARTLSIGAAFHM